MSDKDILKEKLSEVIFQIGGLNVEPDERLVDFVAKEITEAVITELTAVHRTNGEDLPKRDFDNVTDEAICKRIEELEDNGQMGHME